MRDQEIIGLYEAYASIYAQEEVEQLDEGRNTSLSALSRESQKRKEDKERGRPETESEKHGRLMLGKFRPGASKEERAEGGRERLRDRGKVPQKGGKDMFEHILEHLVAEGYAETLEAAIAIMANMDEEWAQSIVEEILDEAEGSYGQTPKATAAYGKLANKRRETPASEFSKRGEKTQKVKSAEKNFYRTLNRNVGNRGRRSSEPSPVGSDRRNMDQEARDTARGRDEYGHTGYDRDFDGGPSAPGSKPKGKKLERQKKTGVSAESFDLFDYILEHLVAEGYADTNEAAIAIMANMSEEWKQSIVEEVLDEASVTDDRVRRNQMAFGSNYTPPRDWDQSANRGRGAVLNAKQKEKQRRKRLAKSAEEN